MRNTTILFLLLWVAVFPAAASNNYPSLGKTFELPEIGVQIKLFKDSEPRPLPTINRVQFLGKDQVNQLEWYLHDQHAGIWGGPGFEIVVGKVSRLYPALSSEMVAPEACEQAAPLKTDMNEAEVDEYIRRFSLVDFAKKEFDKNFYVDRKVVRYDFPPMPNGSIQVGYFAWSTREPERRVYVLYRFSPDCDVKKSLTAAQRSFASLEFRPLDIYTSDGSEKERKAFNRKTPTTPEFELSRQRVIGNIRSYKDWWYQETENFIVMSNMKSNRNITMLLDSLEKCRGAYSAYFPMSLPVNEICTVRLFEKRADYIAYIGDAGSMTIGIWMPGKKELAVSPLDVSSRTLNRMVMTDTICHEAFHQYIHFAVGEVQNAMWFNEGCAKYFEGLDVDSTDHRVELTEALSAEIALALSRGRPDFKRMLAMENTEFYGPDIRSNYALAGGLIFFLYKSGVPEYREIPDVFYRELVKTRDWRQATATAWQGIDLIKFTDDFIEFFGDKKRWNAAERLDPLKTVRPNAAPLTLP